MKRSTKIVTGSLVALGLVGVIAAKQFQAGEHGPGCSFGSGHGYDSRGGWISRRIAGKLDLNEQQEVQLDDLKTSLFEGLDSLRAERLTADQLESVLNTEFDQVKAMQLLEQRLVLIEQNAPVLIGAVAEFYDSLDASQQSELGEMIEYRMAQRGRHWGGRGKDEHR
jgi:protein CpxP